MPRHYRARKLLNHWVEHRGSSPGLGLCIDVGETTAEVDYFPVPGTAPTRKTIPVDELKVTGINFVGRRAWVPNRTYYGYRSGIIKRYDGDNKMFLRFPDGSVEALPAEQIFIRQETPFIDALKAVQLGAVEDAEPYLARRDIVSQLILQCGACRGYDAVPSSAIGFYDHQLETLQRVLEDPICRFILADEVGLGKTIEAGLVIRQTLLDDRNAEIYVSTPSTLVQQWRNELEQKFLLGDLLDGPRNRRTRIWVREHSDILESTTDVHNSRLLIIDEAHQLIQHAMQVGKWPILPIICHNAKGLLLLSATPMRGDYMVLEALLHLVDPVAFPFGDHDAFAERIEERSAELSEFDALTSPFSSPTARATTLANIRGRHPDDPYVQEAAREIASSASDSRIEELGHYLRETYRISRRMVRHRRDVGAATDFPTAGRNLVVLEVAPNASDDLLDEFLDSYRDVIQHADNRQDLMWEAAKCAVAGFVPLNEFLDNRMSELRAEGDEESEEFGLVSQFRARLLLNEDTRLQASAHEACRRVCTGQRVVAISGFHSQAIKFAEAAEEELGTQFTVLRHLTDTAQALRDDIAEEFLFFDSGILLVGDASLEEGTNLQGSDALLNIDLTLSPNRIEQRVGRLDRYSGAGSIRQSERAPDIVVVRPTGSSWCSAQVTTLAEGIRVFSVSVSTAQRFLAKWESELREQLVLDGSKTLEQDLKNLHQSIQVEMAEVDELEAWESDSQQDFLNGLSAERLDGYESRSVALESALLKVNDPKAGLPFRLLSNPGPTFSFSLRPGVRLPPLLDRAVENLLDRPHTVSVEQALELGYGTPFRIGDPLVDWLQQYLQTDERGRAFVTIVRDPKATAWEFWLRCDFLLEFDDVPLAETPAEDRRRLRRRGETFLPPRLLCVWANACAVANDGMSAQLDKLLESGESELSVDWVELHLQIPAWDSECEDAATMARNSVQESDSYRQWVSEAVSQVELDNARRQSVLSARAERLPTESERKSAIKDSELERQLGSLILLGVREPRLQLVNCGALIRRPKWSR